LKSLSATLRLESHFYGSTLSANYGKIEKALATRQIDLGLMNTKLLIAPTSLFRSFTLAFAKKGESSRKNSKFQIEISL
tara:strand:+ start:344 stop:580 length:237 start_codon:yes stop_codon:yes gene_type:complete